MNKTGSKILHGLLLATSGLVGSTLIASTAAMAGGGPTGGTVAVGAATIVNASPTQTVINQSSKKALINWNSFSIPAGSSVKFNQPTSKSLAVNRVTGPSASTIDGQLLANGNVWLINANGVLFGKGSQVNVGSLLATTSDISDGDFQKGNYNFNPAANPNASVVNKGTITAGRGGSVVLSAPTVSNEGLIQADLGTVVLGGAKAFTVDMTGDNLLRYEITAPVDNTPRDANGNAASALVSNSGTIMAAGGHVMMTARAARNIENNVINNTGMVEATTVSSHNGEIDLDAGPDGTANAGGTLDASGAAQGQTGGTVNVTGGTVNVADGAKIDVSGNAGGGTVQIGGGLHGQGTLAHAQRTIIGGATITADATAKGNGGTVAVWSDGATSFAGTISAKGGAQGGNGGQVETSGHTLGVAPSAKVDTSAPLGLTGDWLLDPADLVITSCLTDQSCSGSVTCVDSASITTSLGTTDITETASNSLTVASNSDIIWNSAHSLSLLSQGDIDIKSSIQNAGTGAINVVAGWDGTTTTLANLTSPGVYGLNNQGNVTISGDISNVSVGSAGGSVLMEGFNVSVNANGGYAQIGYNGAGTGNITVNAQNDVMLNASDDDQCDVCYAQIGNGGAELSANVGGNITVNTGGYVSLDAGAADESYAQIGHGGDYFDGTMDGNVTIHSGDTVTLTGSQVHAQIGNGGYDASGATTGDIFVSANGSVTLQAGDGGGNHNSYTQIGSGGDSFGGTINANVTVQSGDTIVLTGGEGHAQIGNGGIEADGTISGDISVTALGDIDLTAGGWEYGYAQIGNGGDEATSTNSGNIVVNATGAISLSGDGDYAQIGNGGYRTSGGNGSITVTAGQDIALTSGDAYAQIGNGGEDANGGTGDIAVTSSNGSILLDGGSNYAEIGNGGFVTTDDGIGNITINAAGNLTLTAGEGGASQIGNGGRGFSGNVSGNIAIQVNDTTSIGSDGWIGNRSVNGTISGDVSIITGSGYIGGQFLGADLQNGNLLLGWTGGDIHWDGFNYNSAHTFSVLATGSVDVQGNIANNGTGAINLVAGWDGQTTNLASLRNAGVFGKNLGSVTIDGSSNNVSVGSAGGTTTVLGYDVDVLGGNGNAQIGYNGVGTGNIAVQATHDLLLTAGAGGVPCCGCGVGSNLGYAQIGNGGAFVTGPDGGNITVSVGNNVTLTGGSNTYSYASIGNGGDTGTQGANGNIVVTAGGSISLTGGVDFAQIGNGQWGSTDGSGNITVTAAQNITLTAADGGQWGYAQIGNGGQNGSGNISGNIQVGAGGALTLKAGNHGMYAQIGNGVNKAYGGASKVSGNININAGSLSLIGSTSGAGTDSYAQIGNTAVFSSGVAGSGAATGSININVTGATTFTSTFGQGHVWIGNVGANGGSEAGAVSILSGTFNSDNENNDDIRNFVVSDLAGGNLTIGVESAGASLNIGDELDYSSANNLTLLTAGNLTINGGIQNAGSGNIMLVTGWNPNVAPANVPTTSGSYGNGNTGFSLGGNNATSSSMVGSALGTTTILTNNLDISAVHGTAGLGFEGAASGNIVVSALGNIALTGQSSDTFALIGNLGIGNQAVSGNVTIADAGSFTLTNAILGNFDLGDATAGGNVGLTASSLAVSGASVLSGNSAVITLTGAGATVGSASNPLLTDVNAIAVVTNNGSAYVSAPKNGLSVGVGNAGINLGTGNLVLNAGGAIGQTAAIGANGLTVTASGPITLNNSGNSFATAALTSGGDASVYDATALSVAGATATGNLTLASGGGISQTAAIKAASLTVSATGGAITLNNSGNSFAIAALTSGGDASVYDATDLSIAGATAAGNLTLASGGSIGQTGAIKAASLTVSATGGAITLNNAANSYGAISLNTTGSFSASIVDSSNLTVGNVNVGGDVTLRTKGNLTFTKSIQLQNGALLAIAGWDGVATGATANGYGNNGGDIFIGGGSASGGVAIGSVSGTTTLAGANITLSATNGYAQIGYHGGGSGAINLLATGNVALNGGGSAGYFAQIGDGGYKVAGSSSEAISVVAGGDIALRAGSGQEAYAQIGNGGAEGNSSSGGYNETGLVTVSGKTVTLAAGSGTGSYAQIGHGGYKSGQAVNGIATLGGNIAVNAVNAIRLIGGGIDAYAQIGQGGNFLNNGAANGSSGTISGDIAVAVATPNTHTGNDPLTLTAGTGANSFAQIGNGGQGENIPAAGAKATFTISGNVTVADLTLTGSNTGTNGYAQIGNGDASKTGFGNVSGQVTLGQGTDITYVPGTAPGSSTGLGNATGIGSVTGTLPNSGVNAGTQGTVASINQNSTAPTNFNISMITVTPQITLLNFSDKGTTSQGPTPLDQLAGNSNSEDQTASDSVSQSVGQSLGDGKTIYVTSKTLIPGMLKQIVTLTRNNPNGIPPADEDYSSWGNEALWRW